VRPIPHQRPAPINRPLAYDDLSDDEDFAEVVLEQDVGVDRRDGLGAPVVAAQDLEAMSAVALAIWGMSMKVLATGMLMESN